jgi:hypothetical protein
MAGAVPYTVPKRVKNLALMLMRTAFPDEERIL